MYLFLYECKYFMSVCYRICFMYVAIIYLFIYFYLSMYVFIKIVNPMKILTFHAEFTGHFLLFFGG